MTVVLLLALLQADAPRIDDVRPARPGPGAKIRIRGARLARLGAQTWVRVPPDLWIEVEDASETEIVLKLPACAEKGPLTVRVGEKAGLAIEIDVLPGFSNPPAAETVVRDRDGFAVTSVSDLTVKLKLFRGIAEAEALAKKHGGSVAGYFPPLNHFTLRFKTTTLPALLEIQEDLEKEEDVESVSILLGLRPR